MYFTPATFLHGDLVSRLYLVDAESGVRLRHRVRTLREANRERDWYERETGRKIHIIKEFAGTSGE